MGLKLYEERYGRLYTLGAAPMEQKRNKMFFSAGGGAVTRGNRGALFNLTQNAFMELKAEGVALEEYGKYRSLVYAYGHSGWSRRLHEV